MNSINYNPDVLDAIANLSNDEVFTPPKVANEMLDMLPQELFESKESRFLDPFCKSGVFLREIAKRLVKGLEKEFPDLQERVNHIFEYQLFGIAITELTALLSRRTVYGSKTANGKYSFCTSFKHKEGNIIFDTLQHTWENGKCIYCGASQEIYDRDKSLETHAYQFIHTQKPQEIFNMKFDVIIGNPPYQLSDRGGSGTSAKPIYHKFIEQAKKLNPRYLVMIIPARWYSGGKGLDKFREEMLNDKQIKELHDYPDASDIFPGVQIKGGICYFIWENSRIVNCDIYNYTRDGKISKMNRPLLEKHATTFIRYNKAIPILHKIQKNKEETIEKYVSTRMPFGITSNIKGQKKREKNTFKLYHKDGFDI